MQPTPDTLYSTDKTLEELTGFLSEGVAVFDADGRLRLANGSFLEMYRGIADVLKPGVPWTIFLREAANRGLMPAPVGQRLDALEAALPEGSNQTEAVQMPSAKGQVLSLRLGQTSDGGFVLTQSAQTGPSDDTNAAREAEILLRKVLEACPASLTMSRVADGQIIYRSPAATDLLGSIKSSFAHFAHREERADFVTLLLPDARVDNMRVTCLRADGTEFPAEISARLIDYRGEDVIVANIEDLTDELAGKGQDGPPERAAFPIREALGPG